MNGKSSKKTDILADGIANRRTDLESVPSKPSAARVNFSGLKKILVCTYTFFVANGLNIPNFACQW